MPDLSNLKSETRTKLFPQEIWMGTKWKFVCEKKITKVRFLSISSFVFMPNGNIPVRNGLKHSGNLTKTNL